MICIDCQYGRHELCRREGGYMDDEDNSKRCACHLSGHGGIPVTKLERAVEQIKSALRDEGVAPEHHRKIMARHREEWPTLWQAIDNLLEAHRTNGARIG